ncbi:hypothetical protein NEOLI_004646 [Neolecta irregularis DAH-3]|uniref:Uncharacterized protein n=1 Tax=Neolecta irregularis (strain DAH-3) TaxID=1198029 RepID=A0A1U7LPI0_NEOID|nr:hypothetical protein NEOLI_004646 [Neolecta irregularis DAH-3]|eukprot:OLL24580.1 hypothetical protein NEOLI_004646 [Neolecta irregularis DAH-3]
MSSTRTTFKGSIRIVPRLSDMLVNYCNELFTRDSSADPIVTRSTIPTLLELDSLRSISRPSEIPLKPFTAPCSGFQVTAHNHTGGCCGSLDHLDCHHIVSRSLSRYKSTQLEIGLQKPCKAADFSFWLQYLIDFIECIAGLVEEMEISFSGEIKWRGDAADIGRMSIESRKQLEATILRPGEIKAFLQQLAERKIALPFRRLDEFRPYQPKPYLSKHMVVVHVLDLKFAGPYLSPEVAPEVHQAGYIHLLCPSTALDPSLDIDYMQYTNGDMIAHSGPESVLAYRLEVHTVKSIVHPQDSRPEHPRSAKYSSEGHIFLRSFVENYDERVAVTKVELDRRYEVKTHLTSLQTLAINQALKGNGRSVITKSLPATISSWLYHQIARRCSTCGILFFGQTRWTTVWQYIEGSSNIFACKCWSSGTIRSGYISLI